MRSEVLDDFSDVSDWMPVASGLAELHISSEPTRDGAVMRLDFDFKGGGGFVVARKIVDRPLPESYALSFAVRGAAPANRFELKLEDASGRNVWWRHWEAFEFPVDWRTIDVRDREVEFAWGPDGRGRLSRLGALELVVAAGPGGRGTVWIGELRLEDRSYRGTPVVTASSAAAGHPPEAVLDGDPATSWQSAAVAGPNRLTVDFGEARELGGLVIEWARTDGAGARGGERRADGGGGARDGERRAAPERFRVDTSGDGIAWTTAFAAEASDVERSFVSLPNACTRFLALVLESDDRRACGIAELAVQPFEFSRSLEAFFEHVARYAPRGHYPRWLAGEGTYWTPAGLPDGDTCAIMNEEGMVEVDRGGFSIEPFVYVDARLLTWADVRISQTLEDGRLPIPSSVWSADELTLHTTAFAARRSGVATLYLRYRLANTAARERRVRLFAALRPFQVDPPWQAVDDLGGMRRIAELTWDGDAVWVDGERAVIPLTAPSGFGATPFARGAITTYLARGALPASRAVAHPFGYASAALAFDLDLAPGATRDVYLAVPFGVADAASVARVRGADGAAALDEAVRDWRARLDTATFQLPPAAREYEAVARTAIGHILVQRDGPALQPGPRRYTRSWIRDGATMVAALLRLGRDAEARVFVRWYAGWQRADGNVPSCVGRDGPDWRAEHDSHGELIFAVMECFRFGADRAFLAEMRPAVRRAVDYLETLRATRLGPDYDRPELQARRGILPESVSHEGYLAHPVHAYWDDFWALQGYSDAAAMAAILGDDAEAQRVAAIRDAFTAALRASIVRTIVERKIDYVPGSVEWADFDPAATAVAVGLLSALDDLPRAPLERTFDQYMEGFRRRRRGEIDWTKYSAYEIRIIPALVDLGRRDDAAELLEFFLGDRRPRGWNQWPEISWRDPRSPGHLGDVPHAWIAAEYFLAFRTLFAYERDDGALVLAAGVPASWLDGGGEVGVTGLPTQFGALDFRLRREGSDTLVLSLGGDVRVPPAGFVVRPPLAEPLQSVAIDGHETRAFDAETATILSCPARVIFRF